MNTLQHNSNTISIDTGRELGLTAKVFLQEQGRTLVSYNQPIDSQDIGKDNNGNPIEVNTVGRWLFGVPGYDGNVRIAAEGTSVNIYYPHDASDAVTQFLSELKNNIEN